MSQTGLYTPPDYAPPELIQPAWTGLERRRQEPIRQLSRALDQLCVEAADTFEIAAHLEALGYDDPRRLQLYGVEDHFILAETMFEQTPRLRTLDHPIRKHPADSILRAAMMVLTLLVTIEISVVTSVQAWVPVIFLLIWSQLGSALLSSIEKELDESERQPLLTLLARSGFVGLALTWAASPFGAEAAVVAVLWLGVTLLVWDRRALLAAVPAVSAGLLLAANVWLGLSLPYMLFLLSAVILVLLHQLLWNRMSPAWSWLGEQRMAMIPHVLCGAGQGCLLIALLGTTPDAANMLPGMVLFIASMLVFESQLLLLQRRLGQHMWSETNERRYSVKARRSLLLYFGTYLLPFIPAFAWWLWAGPQAWFYHWFGFALLGLILSLALVFLSLGDAITPAAILVIAAGVMALTGSLFIVCAFIALLELGFLAYRIRASGRHAINFV